ncbi:MAG: hypothetical protein V4709_12890 [Pseudomonadota bacterium]
MYLQYASGGDTIGADQFQVELINGVAVIRCQLRPVDENQKIDARRLLDEKLTGLQLHDDFIIEGLAKFLDQKSALLCGLQLEITANKLIYKNTVTLESLEPAFLSLIVT